MKSLITGLGLSIVLLICCSIQSLILNQGVREFELSNAINNAVIETQRIYLYSNKIKNQNDYMNTFNATLKNYIQSDGTIETLFYSADVANGLLDVGVSETFKSYNGEKVIYTRRTNMIETETHDEKLNLNTQSYPIVYNIAKNITLDLVDKYSNGNVQFNIKKNKGCTLKIKVIEGTISQVICNQHALPFEIKDGYLCVRIENATSKLILEVK